MRPVFFRLPPPDAKWLFAIKVSCAGLLALSLSIYLGLDRPYWAMMTAFIVAQPFASLSLVKGASRLAGTLIGGIAALCLATWFIQWPLLHLVALSLWLALCIFLSLLEQSLYSYAFLLSGYTALFVTLPYVDHPDGLFLIALSRVEEIGLGIACYLLLDLLLWPRRTHDRFLSQLTGWQQQLLGWQSRLLADPDASGAETLLLQLGQLEQLRPQALSDSSRLRAHRGLLTELHGELQAQLTLGLSLADLLQEARQAGVAMPALDELLALARHTLARLAAGERIGTPPERLFADETHACLTGRLASLLGYWWQSHHLIQQLSHLLSMAPARRRGRRQHSHPHVDVGRALQSALTAGLSLLLCGLLWMTTGWQSGYLAVMMTGVACSLFAASDNPLVPAKGFFIGSLLALPVSAVLQFVFLPLVDDLPGLICVLLPFLLWGGQRIGNPATAPRSVPLVLGTLAMLTITNDSRSTLLSLINLGLAQQVGIGVPLLLTGVLRRLGAQVQLPRLQRALERLFIRVARGDGRLDRAALERHGQAILQALVQRAGGQAGAMLGGGGALLRMGLSLLRLALPAAQLLPHGRRALQESRQALIDFFTLPSGAREQAYPDLLANLEAQRQRLAQPAGAVSTSVLHHFDHLLLALRLHRTFFTHPMRS
ncbi:FUSC family protein [Pseudaeromonas paramecii]|uniref:FUSC family protein n=1 Tax=Pseudaeromonas paramecii TaxID=2138166 RepID=A0ABP8QFU7_9GAMM